VAGKIKDSEDIVGFVFVGVTLVYCWINAVLFSTNFLPEFSSSQWLFVVIVGILVFSLPVVMRFVINARGHKGWNRIMIVISLFWVAISPVVVRIVTDSMSATVGEILFVVSPVAVLWAGIWIYKAFVEHKEKQEEESGQKLQREDRRRELVQTEREEENKAERTVREGRDDF